MAHRMHTLGILSAITAVLAVGTVTIKYRQQAELVPAITDTEQTADADANDILELAPNETCPVGYEEVDTDEMLLAANIGSDSKNNGNATPAAAASTSKTSSSKKSSSSSSKKSCDPCTETAANGCAQFSTPRSDSNYCGTADCCSRGCWSKTTQVCGKNKICVDNACRWKRGCRPRPRR